MEISVGWLLSLPAILVLVVTAVVLVELLGAVLAFELMAFAGQAQSGNGDDKQGKKFHRALLSGLIRKRNPQRGGCGKSKEKPSLFPGAGG